MSTEKHQSRIILCLQIGVWRQGGF